MEPRLLQNTQVSCYSPSHVSNRTTAVDAGQLRFLCAGPKLFKEPSFKSNKFIIHNALSRCCLAGKVNETQKNKIVEVIRSRRLHQLMLIFLSCCFTPCFPKRRRWRRVTPTTSSSCSGILVASSGAFTP